MNVLLPGGKWNPSTALFHIQRVRDSHNSSLDCELRNLRFVSVNRVKSFRRYDSPLLIPIYARQKPGYELSSERDAEDLMVLSMGDHSQVVQHRPKKNNNLSIIIGQLMIRDYTRFHTGLDQVSENLQANVRHDCEMDSSVI